jgi:hypothetical protein
MIWPNEAVIRIGLGLEVGVESEGGGFGGLLFDVCGRNLSGI